MGTERVTVQDEDAVAAEHANRPRPDAAAGERLPFVAFMKSLAVNGPILARERDRGRDEPV